MVDKEVVKDSKNSEIASIGIGDRLLEFGKLYVDGTPISEISKLDAEITKNESIKEDEDCHYCYIFDFIKYFCNEYFRLMDEHIETLDEFAREYDKALEPIRVNNRATRRSKGKMQDASRWKRSNMKRRFYE